MRIVSVKKRQRHPMVCHCSHAVKIDKSPLANALSLSRQQAPHGLQPSHRACCRFIALVQVRSFASTLKPKSRGPRQAASASHKAAKLSGHGCNSHPCESKVQTGRCYTTHRARWARQNLSSVIGLRDPALPLTGHVHVAAAAANPAQHRVAICWVGAVADVYAWQ